MNAETATVGLMRLCAAYGVDTRALEFLAQPTMQEAPITVQDAKGVAGTRAFNGQLEAEPNAIWGPHKVRGQWGNPGTYAAFWRGEPKVFDAVQAHTETVLTGSWLVDMPKDADPFEAALLAKWCAYQTRKLKNLASGWEAFIEQAMTCAIYGAAPFEVVWGWDVDGWRYVHDLQYREISTVDRWYFDERCSEVIAAAFIPYQGTTYELALGQYDAARQELHEDDQYRLMVINVNAHGLNIEGVPPLRPALFYVTLKQLVAQIVGVMAERYGVGILTIFDEGGGDPEQGVDAKEAQDLFNALRYADALGANVVGLPGSLRIAFVRPDGTFPDLSTILTYCDQMIAGPFSNEGSLIGLQAHGSYALGEVKDNETLRSAPYWARAITRRVNELLRVAARETFGELDSWPQLVWTSGLAENASQWLDDASKVFGGPLKTWPRKAQDVALERLGLPIDTMADQPPESLAPDPSLLGEGCGHQTSLADDELIEDAKDARAVAMDDLQTQLATSFGQIQAKMKARWIELIRDNLVSADLLADREQIIREFRPQFYEAVREALEATLMAGALSARDELGITLSELRTNALEPGGIFADLDRNLQLLAISVGDEAFNRVLGMMTDSEIARQGGDKRQTVATLAPGTLAKVSERAISTVFNAGRDSVAGDVATVLAGQGRKLYATYSSVLDRRTCRECKALDGVRVEYKSARYLDIMPPHKCLGGHRCRCIWIYELPSGQRVGVIDDRQS